MFDQILFMIKSLYFSTAFVIGIMTLFLITILIIAKYANENFKYKLLGVFLGLTKKGQIKLCANCLKLLFVSSIVFQLGNLDLINYIALIETIIINFAVELPKKFAFKSLIFDIAIVISCFMLNSLSVYSETVPGTIAFIIVIVFASCFVVLFEIYRFVDEINHLIKCEGCYEA